jgi:hypothetical protein
VFEFPWGGVISKADLKSTWCGIEVRYKWTTYILWKFTVGIYQISIFLHAPRSPKVEPLLAWGSWHNGVVWKIATSGSNTSEAV